MQSHIRSFVVGLAGLALVSPSAARAQDTRPTVAVLYFNNGAIGKNHDELDPLTKGVTDMLITEFGQNVNIRVVERDQIQKLLEEQKLSQSGQISQETAIQLGKILGAHHMVTGGFITDPKGNMILNSRTFSTSTSAIECTSQVRGTTETFMDMIGQLATKINRECKLPAMELRRADAAQPASNTTAATTTTTVAITKEKPKAPFAAVMLYSRALVEKDKGNNDKAVELFRAALAKFPDMENAKVEIKKIESTRHGN